jgi:biotin-dependent carboxylase-like uncharacterized protein
VLVNGFTIDTPGPLTTVQDRGRAGLAAQGIGASGAADRASFDLANRLVGNIVGAPALEITLGGLVFHAHATHEIALTGAPAAATVNEIPFGHNSVQVLHRGQTVRITAPPTGLRTYLAVRGGISAPRILGSTAWDTLARIGTPPLQAGQHIVVGNLVERLPIVDCAPVNCGTNQLLHLAIRLGPRHGWFTNESLRALLNSVWTVTPRIDRIGVELAGPALERSVTSELPSEGVVTGALQVPPSGRPTVFLADHPVTGGYPVIAVATPRSVELIAQARPGQALRFSASSCRVRQ